MKFEKIDKSMLFSKTEIPDIFFTEYLTCANSDSIKVYLCLIFLAKYDKEIKLNDLSKKLNLPINSIQASLAFWEEQGVITKKLNGYILNDLQEIELHKSYLPNLTLTPEAIENNEKNQYRAKAIESINSRCFQGVMSPSWYSDIDLWFKKYEFDEQVMIALFDYCNNKSALHKNYVQTVAEAWNKSNIKTYDELESYFEKYEKIKTIKTSVAKKLRRYNPLTQFEEAYIEKWYLDYNYNLDVINIALKKTTSKANPSFDYLDKLLSDWHDRNLRTTDEIEKFLEDFKQKNKLKVIFMSTSLLNDILNDYEKTRIDNAKILENRKKELFSKEPKLEKVIDEINSLSISIAKNILVNNNDEFINKTKLNINKLSEEKIKILKSLGKPDDYLSNLYTCKNCKDTGYITDSNYKTSMCSCLKQKLFNLEYNKSNISNIENQSFEYFNENLYSDNINENKYLSKISPKENILDIKKASENFINNFDNPNEKNLIFSGGTGLGKTFLSNCIVNELLKKGKTVMYQTAPVMLDSLIADLFAKPNGQKNLSDDLLSVDLLVIDDLGTETMNSMKFTELYKIINTRLLSQNGKITKTIISTNLDLKSMLKTYDERLISRFVGYYNVYRFYGDDIRFKI